MIWTFKIIYVAFQLPFMVLAAAMGLALVTKYAASYSIATED